MVIKKNKASDPAAPLSAARHEMLLVADSVAREKGIEREEVIVAMEQALQKAAKVKYGLENDIRVLLDRSTGQVSIIQCHTVVDTVEDPSVEITLQEAQEREPSAQIGDVLEEPLPPIEFGRVSAQSARQVIFQRVREAERARQFEEYKDRVGQIVSGVVKRVEFGNVIMDLGRAEGMIRRNDLIPREIFKPGDRVRAYIQEARLDIRGPVVSLSRIHPQFMRCLFEQEVPEIYDGVIQVKNIARDPGSRAKMAVFTPDTTMDPVGACVGMRGARVQAVVHELQGEKVDIILWSDNPATFVVNALAPAEIIKVVLDEEKKRVDVVVGEDQLSLAIGRRGQNVRLASQLTGWAIDILTESEETSRRTEEYAARTQLFMDALDVDEMIAQLLATEGFTSIEDITYVSMDEFSKIEGFDEALAKELQTRAFAYLAQRQRDERAEAEQLGMEPSVLDMDGMTTDMALKLVRGGVKTLDDFADLSGDEFLEIVGSDAISLERANEMIMAARAHWFVDA